MKKVIFTFAVAISALLNIAFGQDTQTTLGLASRSSASTTRGFSLYSLELLPGEDFTGYIYYWANDDPSSANLKEQPNVSWIVSISPNQFTSSGCADVIAVGYHFVAPMDPGFYTTTIHDQNGNWDDLEIDITVTTTPAAFEESVTINAGETDTVIFLSYNDPFEEGCLPNYQPAASRFRHRYMYPDVDWCTIDPADYDVMNGDTVFVNHIFSSLESGVFDALEVAEVEFNSYPVFYHWTLTVGGCAAPTGLFNDGITTSSATLHWAAVPGAVYYKVKYKPILAVPYPWQEIYSLDNAKHIASLFTNTVYKWKVKTYCQYSPTIHSGWSEEKSFLTNLRTSFIDDENSNSYTLSANPASGLSMLNFYLAQPSSIKVRLFDINGKEAAQLLNDDLEEGNYSVSINTANLARGLYIVEIRSNSEVICKKMVVQ